jgi:predicted AAA+ superfamily ATPase
MIEGYVRHYGLEIGDEELRGEALEWATTRGSRSGRVAWQFVQELAGRMGKRLDAR